MNISYNWLRELTNTGLAPRELAEQMTRVGLAVEAVHAVNDDYVLDFDLTSNRPDCLSHLGLARELAVIEGARVELPQGAPPKAEGRTESYASVEIRDADLCPRYAARVVRGVTIGPSPDWLRKRLEAIGQRSINNVADITNFVLHEQGQPLHAFDLATLSGRKIVVRRAVGGEKIKTLDGVERMLDAEMLVIADDARAVAVAGVMGGEETEISDATRDVLIESAYFAPASVRRTAKLLGLHTEASHRFERGTDYEGVLRAQERCVALIGEIAGGEATENAIDVYPNKICRVAVGLRAERVKALTGLLVPAEEVRRILTALGFAFHVAGAESHAEFDRGEEARGAGARLASPDVMFFTAPTWRVDIEREEDLVEEVARHVGYEKIASELPPAGAAGEYQPNELRRRAMRYALAAVGFEEAVNFSFIDAAHDDRFELILEFAAASSSATAGGEERFVSLSNSIIEGATRMRPTLLPGLLDAVRRNFNHGTRDVRLFETGRVFAAHAGRGQLPDEREAFALVATGGATEEGRAGAPREVDFYDLKGAFEAAADAMKIAPLNFDAAQIKHLRPGQAARILGGKGEAVGSIGRLEDSIASAYKFRQPVYVAEVDLTSLLGGGEPIVRYAPLPRYPPVVRDVSLLVGRGVQFEEMLRGVTGRRVENLREVRLVDVYEGANLPEGKRSMTLRMQYRADERTLRDEEVDAAHEKVVNALEEQFGAKLRV